jgi:cysteinyl-tRNA synthetase
VEAAERGAERLRQTANSVVSGHKAGKKIDTEHYRKRFIKAMDDDFNTAQAIAALFDLAREINKYDGEGIEVSDARDTLKELAGVMGLTFREPEAPPLEAELFAQVAASVYGELNRAGAPNETQDAEKIIVNLIEIRNELREAEQWQQADMIRDKLSEAGTALVDTPQGTVWKRKR